MGTIGTSFGGIGFEERGGGDAVPIVFLHGVGSDKTVWRPQLEYFGKSRRAIAFDYPGYGESAPVAAATRDDFAAAVLAAMHALDVERAHICGLSLGGVVAIAMHAAAPDRCASLVIADSFAGHPDGAAIYQRSVDASRTMTMRALAEARVDMLLGSVATRDLRREVIDTMAAIDPDAYRIGAEAVWLADQRDRAAGIAVPTLILCGTEDRITPPGLSEELAEFIPGARLEPIPAAGHLANAEQPAEFNAAIDAFLSETEKESP
jgi:3-oxoadipate enol-lactonase